MSNSYAKEVVSKLRDFIICGFCNYDTFNKLYDALEPVERYYNADMRARGFQNIAIQQVPIYRISSLKDDEYVFITKDNVEYNHDEINKILRLGKYKDVE